MRSPVVVAAAVFAAACSTPAPPQDGADEYVLNCEGVDGGQGVTSDENWSKFVEAEAARSVKPDGCKSPDVSSPAEGAVLDPSAPPTVTFLATHATCGLEEHRRVRFGGCPPAREGWPTRALGLLLLESPALAHCGAITGDNYYLKLATASGELVYSAMLSVTTFTPDPAIWKARLAAHAGESLELTIARAVFLKGDISDGPFAPLAARKVSVKR